MPYISAKAICSSGFTSPKNADIGPHAAFAESGSSRHETSPCASSFLLYDAFTVVRTRLGPFICFTAMGQIEFTQGYLYPLNRLRNEGPSRFRKYISGLWPRIQSLLWFTAGWPSPNSL